MTLQDQWDRALQALRHGRARDAVDLLLPLTHGEGMDAARARVHLAHAYLLGRDYPRAETEVRMAVELAPEAVRAAAPETQETLLQFTHVPGVREALGALPVPGATLRTFGQARLEGTEQSHPFSLTRVVPLLAYVALAGECAWSDLQRDVLDARDVTRARAYWRAATLQIRRALGEDVLLVTGPRSDARIALAPGRVEVDAARFAQSLREDNVVTALALYRGPFLPDLHTRWAQERREAYERDLLAVLRRRAERFEREGDLRRAALSWSAAARTVPHDREVLTGALRTARLAGDTTAAGAFETALRKWHSPSMN